VQKNSKDAYKWFTLSARQGFPKATLALTTVGRTLTAAERVEAEFNANLVAATIRY
jgi:TPR repeat protein